MDRACKMHRPPPTLNSCVCVLVPTGQCCAHLQCAAWSEGVCCGEGQSLLYVDKAIDSGSTQVCFSALTCLTHLHLVLQNLTPPLGVICPGLRLLPTTWSFPALLQSKLWTKLPLSMCSSSWSSAELD